MTPDEFADKMREILQNDDNEAEHSEADSVIIGLLRELGYGEGADLFYNSTRWYS